MTEFTKGDCVRLKSGGPTMSVTRPNGLIHRNDVWVIWIDDGGQKHERHYPAESLVRVERNAGSAGAGLSYA